MKKNKFNPGARITIFFVTFAIIFFSLGLWQIERGQAKTVLLDEFDKNSVIEPSRDQTGFKKMGKSICGRNMVWSQSNIN